jgi:hypothetical protein
MRCDHCSRDAIILQRYSGLCLCPDHFRLNLAARAKRAIRAHGWIRTGDRIAVALSGGVASSSLLHLLSVHFGIRRDLSLVALTVDEDGSPGRDLDRIQEFARGLGVEWESTSFAEEFGDSLDGIPVTGDGGPSISCSTHLRQHALASLAVRAGATRLALGTSLDDEARAVLAHVLRGNASRLMYRRVTSGCGIPLIMPFERIPEAELALYAELNLEGCTRKRRTRGLGPFESEAWRFLDQFTSRHPSTPFTLARMGEALSGSDGSPGGDPGPRAGCGEPCAGPCPARVTNDRVAGHG